MNVLTVMISIMGVIVDQDKIRTHQVLTFEARSRFVSTFFISTVQCTLYPMPA